MDKDGGLRTLFRNRLSRVHWTSIESSLTGAGIPDANGCCDGVEFWIEFKHCHANAVAIAPFQVAWAERRLRAGGRTFLAVRRTSLGGRRTVERDELHLFPGSAIRAVKDGGLAATAPAYLGEGGPSRWDWGRVERCLILELN